MPKNKTATVSRNRDSVALEPWSRGRKEPGARALFNPSSPESLSALDRVLNQTPEVMVKVTGGGKDAGTAEAHINYIDRQGELDVHTDEGEVLAGKDVAQTLIEDWGLEMIIKGKDRRAPLEGELDKNGRPKRDLRPKLVHNIVLSMPSCTPPEAVLKAAQKFARENFALSHRYAMVLHDPATDPKHEKTQSGKNPHVHLVVKAVSEEGKRLYIRKDTLQRWRGQFAQYLREQGIPANATPAAIRGRPKSDSKSAIHQHEQRLEQWRSQGQGGHMANMPVKSDLLQIRVERVLQEIVNGVQPDPSGKAKLVATHHSIIADWLETEKVFRKAGNHQDADRIRHFVNTLAPAQTRHEQLKEQMLFDGERLQAALTGYAAKKVNQAISKGDDLKHER